MTSSGESQETEALAGELSRWFDHAGVQDPASAVDLADVLHAARQADLVVRSLMRLTPGNRAHAEMAIEELGKLHAWLFTEMKPHLAELEAAWPSIEAPIVGLLPDES